MDEHWSRLPLSSDIVNVIGQSDDIGDPGAGACRWAELAQRPPKMADANADGALEPDEAAERRTSVAKPASPNDGRYRT